jgi:hypothetical protein
VWRSSATTVSPANTPRTFFDSQRHVIVDELSYDAGKWTWTGERIPYNAEFSDDGKIQRALHEQLKDGGEWRLAMGVKLRKIAWGSP